MPDRTSSAPDHLYDPAGLTVEDLIHRLQASPRNAKVQVDSAGDEDHDPEGSPLGKVVEIQWGRDGNVYLRVNQTLNHLREV